MAKPVNTQGHSQAAIVKLIERANRPPQQVNEYGRSLDKPISGSEAYREHRRMVGEGKTHLRNQVQVVKDERVARGQPAVPPVPKKKK